MPIRAMELAGQTFTRWTVLSRYDGPRLLCGPIYWVCRCECGNVRAVEQCSLRAGKSRSCGCLRRELLMNRGNNTHDD